jgi:hypothetical protein
LGKENLPPEYKALVRALGDVGALAREHDGEGAHDPLRNAALDLWHDFLTMGWKEEMPQELVGSDERADHVGRRSFVMGVLAGSRIR